MRPADYAGLLLLGAIWGSPFIFLRVAAPALGVMLTAELRLLFASMFLVTALWLSGRALRFAEHWSLYAKIGVTNSALPFAAFAFAALHLPSGYLGVLNGTAPLFGALFAAWLIGEPMTLRKSMGLVLGLAGVAIMMQLSPIPLTPSALLAALAGLIGSAAWGLGGALIKRRSTQFDPLVLAAGTQFAAFLVLTPTFLATPPVEAYSGPVVLSVVMLGVLCTGVTYMLYFHMVRDIGPSRALSVTYLVPLFGMLWGWVFLGEPITASMLVGRAIVVAGMALVLDVRFPAAVKRA
jgi:drug/metabolite transporter (DMT)-like permease